MTNLCSIAIPVADSSAETRAKVLPQAFDQVLRKLSSSSSVENMPQMLVVKQDVEKYLSNYFYLNKEGVEYLNLHFNEQMLENLLADLGRPRLGFDRPQVLFWLVVEDEHKPMFVANGVAETLPIASKIDALSNDYAVPIIIPLLDLTERLFISEKDVQNFNEPPLQQASGRYNAESVLLGSIKRVAGIWNCEWRLIDRDRSIAWNTTGTDINAELELMINNLAGHLIATHGSLYNQPIVPKQHIALRVNGVRSVSDYAKVLAYLKQLAGIKQVEIGAVAGNQATFIVTAEGNKEGLVQLLQMDSLLIADAQASDTNQEDLVYRIAL